MRNTQSIRTLGMHVVQAVRVGRNEVTAPWPSANDNRLHPKGMGPVVIVAAQHSNPRTARSAGRKGGEERSDGSLASANDTGLQLCRRADHSDGGTAHQSEMRARASPACQGELRPTALSKFNFRGARFGLICDVNCSGCSGVGRCGYGFFSAACWRPDTSAFVYPGAEACSCERLRSRV